jgi:hypothetical protein
MFRADVEEGILAALGRFHSLDREQLIREVLNIGSNWSARNERLLDDSLRKLLQEGRIVSPQGLYGSHTLAPDTHRKAERENP